MVSRVGVVGGGAMGTGIAVEFAVAGRDVAVMTRSDRTGAAALERIRRDLELMVDTGLLTTGQAATAASRVRTTTSLDEVVDGSDHVVESVPEDVALKREVFTELDKRAPGDVLLATNTTSLPVSAIAAGCRRPQRVLATHYYLPAHLVPLVDVVPGEHTSPEAIDRACRLLTELGKTPVPFKVDAGATVGPRLQTAMISEAIRLVSEGVTDPLTVDRVIVEGIGRRFGVTGVFDRLDLAGLDTMTAVLRAQGRPVPGVLAEKVEAGHLGRKSGRGFYEWSPRRAAEFDDRVARHLIAQLPRRPAERPAVSVDVGVLGPFLEAAVDEYESCTPEAPPRCFALLVGEQSAEEIAVRRLHFARNVRDEDPDASVEFAEHIVPCFGAAYANRRRGFWVDATDVLRAHRAAEADGLELLGSIHLHPDWHRIGPPGERGLRISQRPTPMDTYVFRQTGWPLNMITYLERRGGRVYSSLGAWAAPGRAGECAELDVRLPLT
jgi:3-hydroxyacyl-CoA dehydrogenase